MNNGTIYFAAFPHGTHTHKANEMTERKYSGMAIKSEEITFNVVLSLPDLDDIRFEGKWMPSTGMNALLSFLYSDVFVSNLMSSLVFTIVVIN